MCQCQNDGSYAISWHIPGIHGLNHAIWYGLTHGSQHRAVVSKIGALVSRISHLLFYTMRSSRNPVLKRTKRMRSRSASARPWKVRRTDTLGSLGGSQVAPSRTTMARAQGPFGAKKYTDLVYQSYLRPCGGAAVFSNCYLQCNSAFDPDGGGFFGNEQPLFYDTLLTASGPYRGYKVISWKTTYTIVNNTGSPLNCFAIGAYGATAEFDSITEANNFPGVKRQYLTAKSGGKDTATITVTGHIKDVNAGTFTDSNNIGAFNSNPGAIVYGGLLVSTSDGTTSTAEVHVAVRHEMYTELQQVDAVVS